MNNTQCVSKISEELTVNDLSNNLNNNNDSKENEQVTPIVLAFGSYWDSFVS